MTVSAYRLSKSAYRTIVPRTFDRWVFDGKTPLSRQILRVKASLERNAAHDDLYDTSYFERYEHDMTPSAEGIAASIIERLPEVRSVVDVGCGSGAIMDMLRERGVSVRGLDYSEAALRICRDKGLDVLKFDLEQGGDVPTLTADLALSTEVAEHLPPKTADAYIDVLVRISDIVVITAATPGQGGTDNVNEQPNAYWIEKFAARGFAHDPDETQSWRQDWRARNVDTHRSKNVMIFRRGRTLQGLDT
jgi:cyclopropane fatty-acyl-phospholipid synthase-like methyltransferase